MTIDQKQRMLQLRAEGKTYTAIAETMGFSPSAVKSFFSREGARAVVPDEFHAADERDVIVAPIAGVCRQCGADLKLHAGNQMKRFCSESCRQKWWRAHPGFITDKASTSTCAGCGAVFKNGGNPARRYCTRACYIEHRFGKRDVNGAI